LRPFRIEVPEVELDGLRHRLSRTRWPAGQPEEGWSRGVPPEYLQSSVEYWRTSYQWRVHERLFNAYPQYTVTIDGERIHFLHVISPEEGALPLVLTHGWPGSIAEFLEVVGPLSDPRRSGGDPADAFHLVVPSLPGFGFSGPTRSRWGVRRVAAACVQLMRILGYSRYGAQGGDFGALVAREVGRIDPENVVAVHLSSTPAGLGSLSPEESPQGARPQTLAYALTDAPAGLLAWMLEEFRDRTGASALLPEDAIDLDLLLTNATIYWLTATYGSAARVRSEGYAYAVEPSTTPTGVAVFPFDRADRKVAERANRIVRWSRFDRGGHFAALETPDLLIPDLRELFRGYRKSFSMGSRRWAGDPPAVEGVPA
jgi:pimeloyl-ACP methyl ester carboxylesterase